MSDWLTLPFLDAAARERVRESYVRATEGDETSIASCLLSIPSLLATCAEQERRIAGACALLDGSVTYFTTPGHVPEPSGLFTAEEISMRRRSVAILRGTENDPTLPAPAPEPERPKPVKPRLRVRR